LGIAPAAVINVNAIALQIEHGPLADRTKIRTEVGNMLVHPNGADAEHKAAKDERVALENYARALETFTDLIIHGRRSIPPGDAES